MKQQVLMYAVSAAIAVLAVILTSIAKLITCAVLKKHGKDMSGNAKEYVFTPIALILSALGLYLWLDKGMKLNDDELFILIVVCFSVGTMLIYWLIFQPTRKIAEIIIKKIAEKANLKPVIDIAEDIIQQANGNAKIESLVTSNEVATESVTSEKAEKSLQELVESINKSRLLTAFIYLNTHKKICVNYAKIFDT